MKLPGIQFKTIKTQLIVVSLLMSLVPLAIVGAISFNRSKAALHEASAQTLVMLAQGAIDKIDRLFFERLGDAKTCAESGGGSLEAATQLANSLVQSYSFYELVILADADGKIIAVNTIGNDGRQLNTSPLIGKSVKGEEWFEKCISGAVAKGEAYTSDPQEDKAVQAVFGGRGLAINLAAPVFDKNGKVIRVWSNRASWKKTAGAILDEVEKDSAAIGRTVGPILLSKDGTTIYYSDEKQIFQDNLKGTPSVDAVTHGETGCREYVSPYSHQLS